MIINMITEKFKKILDETIFTASRHGELSNIDWKADISRKQLEQLFTEQPEDPNDPIEWGAPFEETVVISMRGNYHRKSNGKYFKTDNLVNPEGSDYSNVWVLPSSQHFGEKIKKIKQDAYYAEAIQIYMLDRYDRNSGKEPYLVSQDYGCDVTSWDEYIDKFMNSEETMSKFTPVGYSYWQKGKLSESITDRKDYKRKKNGKYFIKQSPPPLELFDIGFRSKIKPTTIKPHGKLVRISPWASDKDIEETLNQAQKLKQRREEWLEESWLSRLPYSQPSSKVPGNKQKDIEKQEFHRIYEDTDDKLLTAAILKEFNDKSEYELLNIRYNRLIETRDSANYLQRNGQYFCVELSKIRHEFDRLINDCNAQLKTIEKNMVKEIEPQPPGAVCPVCASDDAYVKDGIIYCSWGCESEFYDVPTKWPEPQPPGSVCPSCGSLDADIENGEMKCYSCGSEGSITVDISVSKWPEPTRVNPMGGFRLKASDILD